jgi:hypothetical protein
MKKVLKPRHMSGAFFAGFPGIQLPLEHRFVESSRTAAP